MKNKANRIERISESETSGRPVQRQRGGRPLSRAEFPASEQASVCKEPLCERPPFGSGYCRLHYIKNWETIKQREAILREGYLQRYIQELVERATDSQLLAIREDLSSEESFTAALREMDLDREPDEQDFNPESGEGSDPFPPT